MDPSTSSPSARIRLLVLGVAATAAAVAGHRAFFFLTDDAFITFRYASNHQLGHGFTWNPPPFLPVEGYTSWLWLVLLDGVWSATGVEPPRAAGVLSLGFGLATLFVVARFVWRMPLPVPLAAHRTSWLALVLFGTLTNRTFLAWLSSGLETALFNFAFTLWLYLALAQPEGRSRPAGVFGLALAAALAALTRPDGVLLLGGTVALFALDARAVAGGGARALAAATPLLAPLAHLLWRRATYGEWLPNTYYAKVVATWPEAGWRYAASFALEYALWIWLALAAAWLVRRRGLDAAVAIAAAVPLGHFGYYTFVVGGDHFEYRVYSHLVPLFFVSLLWLAAQLSLRPRHVAALFALFVLASWPLPWVHYAESRHLSTRQETFKLALPVAPHLPPGLSHYARAFDALQAWLIERSICIRHQEHKAFHDTVAGYLPPRDVGARISWDGRPVAAQTSVGLLAWRLPHVAILDELGLNDFVVARTPTAGGRRVMAHDRRPPEGYVACFRPNVALQLGEPDPSRRVVVTPRELRDDEIVACERRFRAGAGGPS